MIDTTVLDAKLKAKVAETTANLKNDVADYLLEQGALKANLKAEIGELKRLIRSAEDSGNLEEVKELEERLANMRQERNSVQEAYTEIPQGITTQTVKYSKGPNKGQLETIHTHYDGKVMNRVFQNHSTGKVDYTVGGKRVQEPNELHKMLMKTKTFKQNMPLDESTEEELTEARYFVHKFYPDLNQHYRIGDAKKGFKHKEDAVKKAKEYNDNKDKHEIEHEYKVVGVGGIDRLAESEQLDEMVIKRGDQFHLVSHTGKVLGVFKSAEAAKNREHVVNYFKHLKEAETELYEAKNTVSFKNPKGDDLHISVGADGFHHISHVPIIGESKHYRVSGRKATQHFVDTFLRGNPLQESQPEDTGDVELGDYRKKVKALGYKMPVNSYSEFKAVREYVHPEHGTFHNSSSVHSQDVLNTHADLIKLRQEHKGKVFDGYTRVII